MRYRELDDTRRRQIRYGALAIAILLLGAGAIAFSHSNQRSTAAPDTAAPRRAAQAAPAAPIADGSSQQSADDLTPTISGLRRDEAVNLIGEARRQAAAGNFVDADASLQKAQQAAPGLPEIEQARRDIDRLRTPEGSFAEQLHRAELALEHDDPTAAQAALAEADRLKPGAPEIVSLRASLQQVQEKVARREARIADALTRMREAVARRDFASADSALNEAERIDIQNPAIRRARGELARARGTQVNNPQ